MGLSETVLVVVVWVFLALAVPLGIWFAALVRAKRRQR